MPHIKGLVLLTRLEYLEMKHGVTTYREFLKSISSEDHNFVRQTVDAASQYADEMLARIDHELLENYFDNDLEEFRRLGEWNADNLMYRYFNLYIDENKPAEFMEQYARLRSALIGSGDMTVQRLGDKKIQIIIDYGQSIPRSVCLSEQGFLSGGMELCGARNVNIEESSCASEPDSYACRMELNYV